jgi:hypothetical protein
VINTASSLTKRTLIKALILELKLAQSYFNIDQKRKNLEVLKNVAILFQDINNQDKAKTLIKSLEDNDSLWTYLKSDYKSKFLGDMIYTASKLVEERLL